VVKVRRRVNKLRNVPAKLQESKITPGNEVIEDGELVHLGFFVEFKPLNMDDALRTHKWTH
jgi:hypothetical protein